MQRHRFYAPRNQISSGRATLLGDEAHHLSRVLRLAAGDEIFVFDGEGTEHKCRIVSVGKEGVEVEIMDTARPCAESPIGITLAQALVKGEKFDLIVQKATELGISAITPLETDHSDIKLKGERTEKKLERWRRISLESVKQCGRTKLVDILLPVTVDEFLEAFRKISSSPNAEGDEAISAVGSSRNEAMQVSHFKPVWQDRLALLFNERGGLSLSSALSGSGNPSSVVAIVGPEGGWSQRELGVMINGGCVPVTLGPRILRTETAALAAVTLIQHHLGDLSSRDRN